MGWEFVHHILVRRYGSVEASFAVVDSGGDGTVNWNEFADLMEGWNIDSRVTSLVYCYLDRDETGSISEAEWLTLEEIETAPLDSTFHKTVGRNIPQQAI